MDFTLWQGIGFLACWSWLNYFHIILNEFQRVCGDWMFQRCHKLGHLLSSYEIWRITEQFWSVREKRLVQAKCRNSSKYPLLITTTVHGLRMYSVLTSEGGDFCWWLENGPQNGNHSCSSLLPHCSFPSSLRKRLGSSLPPVLFSHHSCPG